MFFDNNKLNTSLNDEPSLVEKITDRIHEKTSLVLMLSYSHVSNNHDRQIEIFHALSNQDLNKVILNLKD